VLHSLRSVLIRPNCVGLFGGYIIKDSKQPCERKALAPCATTQGSGLPLIQRKCWLIGRQPSLHCICNATAMLPIAASHSKSVKNPRRIGDSTTLSLRSCRKNGGAAQRLTGGPGINKVLLALPSSLNFPPHAATGVSSQADLKSATEQRTNEANL